MTGAATDPEDGARGQAGPRRGRRVRGYPSGGPTPGDLGVPPDAISVDDLLSGEPAVPPGLRSSRPAQPPEPSSPVPSSPDASRRAGVLGEAEPLEQTGPQPPTVADEPESAGRRRSLWRRWMALARRSP